MPVLHILSHEGVLNVFDVINVRKDAAHICSPPQAIQDQSGLSQFTEQTPKAVQQTVANAGSPFSAPNITIPQFNTKPLLSNPTATPVLQSIGNTTQEFPKPSFSFSATSTPVSCFKILINPKCTKNRVTVFFCEKCRWVLAVREGSVQAGIVT